MGRRVEWDAGPGWTRSWCGAVWPDLAFTPPSSSRSAASRSGADGHQAGHRSRPGHPAAGCVDGE